MGFGEKFFGKPETPKKEAPEKELNPVEKARADFFKDRHADINQKATEALIAFIQSDEFASKYEAWLKGEQGYVTDKFKKAVESWVREKNVELYNAALMETLEKGEAYQDYELDPKDLMVTWKYLDVLNETLAKSPRSKDQEQDMEVVEPPVDFDEMKAVYEAAKKKPAKEEQVSEAA